MKAFADLYAAIDQTTKTNEKIEAMSRYFEAANFEDAIWAIYFLSGRKLRQAVPTRRLCFWARELAGVAEWLFDESYSHVGDLAETIALLLPSASQSSNRSLHEWVEDYLLPLRELPEEEQKASILSAWTALDTQQRFIWNKLITGSFRVGVSQLLLVRALARVAKIDVAVLKHRLMGEWQPTAEFYRTLMALDATDAQSSRPYPFFLAYPLEIAVGSTLEATLGPREEWQVEWKWDGIRAQVIRRRGQSFIWTRGEELVTDRYPEVLAAVNLLPDGTVIDGELLPMKGDELLPFADLQKRIGRKTTGKKLLADIPVILMAYDLIELDGTDLREEPLHLRRNKLETLISAANQSYLRLSPLVKGQSWDELAEERRESRERGVEGMMIKRMNSPYRVGRVRGDWWKWKVEPFTVDAVLIYAQPGHGKRSGLFTDYTFGIWDEGKLVPFAKAYSGLTDAEIRAVDSFIRKNTLEKFGPVRTVTPALVFELGFEGIRASTRHKSGVAVRFPRMLRWRTDKKPEDADTLERVKMMLADGGAESDAPP